MDEIFLSENVDLQANDASNKSDSLDNSMDQSALSENVDLETNNDNNETDTLDNSMDQRVLSEDVDIERNNSCSEMDTLDNSIDQSISQEDDLEVIDDSSGTVTLDNSMDEEKSLSENAALQLTDIRIDSDVLAVSDDCMEKMEECNSNNNKEVIEFAEQEEDCEEIDVVNINSPKVEKSLPSTNSEALVTVSDISEVELIDESFDQKEPNVSNVKSTVMVLQKDVEKEKRGDVELSPSKSNCDALEEDSEVKGKSDPPCVTTSKPQSETTGVLLCNDTNISMQEQPCSSNTNSTGDEKAPIEMVGPSKDTEQKEIDPLGSDTSPMFTDDDDSRASPKTDMLEVLLEEDEGNGDFEAVISDATQCSREGSKVETGEDSDSTESLIEVDVEVKTKESVPTESLEEFSTEVEAEKEHASAESSKDGSAEVEAEKECVSAEICKEVTTEVETEKECVSAEICKEVSTEVETENISDKKSKSMEERNNNNAKQGLSETEKESDRTKKQSQPKSFIEEFLSFSQGDADGENRNSGEESQKALPLNRFPKIVKNVTKAEYPLLQELYKLLYLRNPWDTKEILAQRILEFSGFTFKQDSEDYYTREVILRTMPENNLEAIGTLLCIENIRSLSANMSKSRHILVSNLMEFLSKPRRQRKSRPVMTLSNKQYRPRYPGPKCSKVKENVIDLDNEELENLKKKILNGTSPQPKVLLKRIDLSVFCNFFAGASNKGLQLESQDNKSCPEEKEDEVELEESDNKDDSLVELQKKKLKDFPKIVKEMEIFSEEMLLDIHFLLYSKFAEIKNLKANILEFTGFQFNSESEEYEEKREFLDKMNLEIVQSISKVFCLPFKKVKGSVINQILLFLQTLSEPTQEENEIKSERRKARKQKNASDGNSSDSEGSITCEVVPKKVELIDLISSGEESGNEDSKVDGKPRKTKKKRTLANFETITKIVNTHPSEYLVDIFNLLYMEPYEPKTLREDILKFSGFKFDKSSPEHTKRKQFMDRMQYNSVRRVYNTLIHNSTEVKVFSKPVMNAEIFEFLFNLPETDTSIRILPGVAARPAPPAAAPRQQLITNPTLQGILKGCHPFQNQAQTKLSDLKRVFQRVACFPCEYLVDVHKLLFMKDCDMKDIRQNIFNFKGFDFDQNSSEFRQRKMYLEYLTFHSLRKISSVLTTRTVDLRNSTKHELANHLTQVLAEYTNISQDKEQVTKEPDKVDVADKVGESISAEIPVIESPVAKKDEKTEVKLVDLLSTPKSKSTEEIVKDGKQKYSCGNDVLDLTVTSSSSALEIKIQNVPESKNDSKQVKPPLSREKISAAKEKKKDMPPKVQIPKVSYSKKAKTKYYTPSRGNAGSIPVRMLDSCKKYTDMVNQQLQQTYSQAPFAHPVPVPRARIFPVVHNFPPPVINRLPNPNSHIFPDIRPNPEQVYQDYPSEDFDDYTVSLPVECILTEDSDNEPQAKKPKLMLQPQLHHQPQERVDNVPQHSASFQMKIRNAMTKASDDEEDCDRPLAALVGHPNDKVLKQQICEIVEKTDLQEITINGVIQKIFALYPQFNLNYRKEFIKSTLRSLLYRLGEQDGLGADKSISNSPDCSVSTTDPLENAIPLSTKSGSLSIIPISLSHTLPASRSHPMPVPIGDLPITVVLNKQHQKS